MTNVGTPDRRDDQALIDAYLLDRLDAAERAAVEDRVFDDETFGAAVLDREHDLVDALAAGTLSADDARRLAARLGATSDGESRVRLAGALRAWQQAHSPTSIPTAVAAPSGPGARAGGWWLRGAAAALAAAMAWLAIDDVRLRERIRDLEARPAPSPPVRVDSTPPAARDAVRVVLSAIRTRGSAVVTAVEVPAGANAVHLVLPSAAAADRFEARVETSPGAELVAQLSNLRRNADGAVDVWLDARQLPDGDYEVLLSSTAQAAGLVGQYAFRVRRVRAASP